MTKEKIGNGTYLDPSDLSLNTDQDTGRRGPPKGIPIEVAGRMWARQATERIREGVSKAILISRSTEQYDRVWVLPTLTGERDLGWNSVWYDEVGNMYMSRWPEKKIKEREDGTRFVINLRGYEYEFLNRKRVKKDFFDNPPRTVPIRELVLDTINSDVETAIRKARHVTERSKDEEVVLARRVVEYTDSLANKFITTKMTKWSLENLARQTVEFLEEIELLDPNDSEKQKIQYNLLQSTVEDSMGGYFNPMIARVRARAAYLAAMRRIAVQGLVVRKFAAIEQILIYEREVTRWALEAGTSQFLQIIGHADFSRPDGSATMRQRAAIANIFFDVSENHLTIPRVKPYLAPACYAIANLIGIPERDKSRTVKVLGEDITEELLRRDPVRKLVIEGRFSEVKERVEKLAVVNKAVLEEYESIEKKERET